MPKHKRMKQIARGNLLTPRVPYVVQVRLLQETLQMITGQAIRMRKLLWLSVHKAGNRIDMTHDDYKMAMQMPSEDSIVKVEIEKDAVSLVFADEDGNRLPESDKKLVIATDA